MNYKALNGSICLFLVLTFFMQLYKDDMISTGISAILATVNLYFYLTKK